MIMIRADIYIYIFTFIIILIMQRAKIMWDFIYIYKKSLTHIP